MKLSTFIIEAIKRIRENIDRNKYNPIFNKWHAPGFLEGEPCFACLGGLDAAAQNWVHHDETIETMDVDNMQRNRAVHLLALDRIRKGHYRLAQGYLGIPKKMSVTMEDEIDSPDYPSFSDWLQFDLHLSSLEEKAALMAAAGF